jgi:four helix bundle protein
MGEGELGAVRTIGDRGSGIGDRDLPFRACSAAQILRRFCIRRRDRGVNRARAIIAHSLCMSIQSYRDLEAWQLAMQLVVRAYELSAEFPQAERYGLTSQLRRAAVSVPSNIAEGHQHPTKHYLHFVTVAIGSLAEAETQIELAVRLRMTPAEKAHEVAGVARSVGRLLHALRRSLRVRLQRQHARRGSAP